MLVYYASLSGNVRRFAARLPEGFEVHNINDNPVAAGPFVLLTYTFSFGQVPKPVEAWLERNSSLLRGVAVSGNRNWGDLFGRAGDTIAARYNVPLLHKFELSGSEHDINDFIRKAAIHL